MGKGPHNSLSVSMFREDKYVIRSKHIKLYLLQFYFYFFIISHEFYIHTNVFHHISRYGINLIYSLDLYNLMHSITHSS